MGRAAGTSNARSWRLKEPSSLSTGSLGEVGVAILVPAHDPDSRSNGMLPGIVRGERGRRSLARCHSPPKKLWPYLPTASFEEVPITFIPPKKTDAGPTALPIFAAEALAREFRRAERQKAPPAVTRDAEPEEATVTALPAGWRDDAGKPKRPGRGGPLLADIDMSPQNQDPGAGLSIGGQSSQEEETLHRSPSPGDSYDTLEQVLQALGQSASKLPLMLQKSLRSLGALSSPRDETPDATALAFVDSVVAPLPLVEPPVPRLRLAILAASSLSRSRSEPQFTRHLPAITGKERSKKLMDTLYDLRRGEEDCEKLPEQWSTVSMAGSPRPKGRTGCEACPVFGEKKGPTPSKEEAEGHHVDDTLLKPILADCKDTIESLTHFVEVMHNIANRAGENGGSRHASSRVAARITAIAERKLELLVKLVDSTQLYQDLCKRRDRVLTQVCSGMPAAEAAGGAAEFPDVLSESVHEGGNPEDGDRVNFEIFLRTFALPARHWSLVQGNEIFHKEVVEWTQAILAKAKTEVEKEASAEEIDPESPAAASCFRLIDLAEFLGVNLRGEEMKQVEKIAYEARAHVVLRFAESEWERDDKIKPMGEKGYAKTAAAADAILGWVKAAVDYGVLPGHCNLQRARELVQELWITRARRITGNLLKLMKPNTAGEGTRVAEGLKEAAAELTRHGLRDSHDFVQELKTKATELLAEDTKLKRLANRDKAKAAEAAKGAK